MPLPVIRLGAGTGVLKVFGVPKFLEQSLHVSRLWACSFSGLGAASKTISLAKDLAVTTTTAQTNVLTTVYLLVRQESLILEEWPLLAVCFFSRRHREPSRQG